MYDIKAEWHTSKTSSILYYFPIAKVLKKLKNETDDIITNHKKYKYYLQFVLSHYLILCSPHYKVVIVSYSILHKGLRLVQRLVYNYIANNQQS